MFHPKQSQLVLLALIIFSISSISTTFSSPLSTIAIAQINKLILICALVPSSVAGRYDLNCTIPSVGIQRNYPSGASSYSAVAAGNGFLCAIDSSSNTTVMRWWDLEHRPTSYGWSPDYKRVYRGPLIVKISAGESHVCALPDGGIESPHCWRWPELSVPAGLNFSDIAVGGNFLCGLLSDGGKLRCFGNDTCVVGKEPAGSYVMLASGTWHACAVSGEGKLVCWGAGAPKVEPTPFEIRALALGENNTCALSPNGTVRCWGENSELPASLASSEFVAIEAKGNALCGVLMANYSLVCWGNDIFKNNSVVYDLVLPGTCAPVSSCSCGVLPGSGNICDSGKGVCLSCQTGLIASSSTPPPISNPILQPPRSNGTSKRRIVFIAVGSAGIAVGLLVLLCFIFNHLRRPGRFRIVHNSSRPTSITVASFSSLFRAPPSGVDLSSSRIRRPANSTHSKRQAYMIQEIPLSVLLDVTGNFSESHKIGSGSFGSVYRAVLDDGRVVAIKRAEASSSTSTSKAAARHRHRDKESAFLSELALLSRVNHKNLVQLIGYCRQGTERVLVYEFMANGTLHDHLHRLRGSALASWAARLRAALDAARGIEYLHVYAVPPIIHRDIKSSNILLDDTWTAKVSDFGLSLMSPTEDEVDTDESGSVRAAGTVGYMDPEYYRLQYLTAKSDVYSFGVVLLELLTGCRAVHRFMDSGTPRNVVEFAVPQIAEDNVHQVLDPQLPPPTPFEIEAVIYMAYLAADCVSTNGRDRPTMTEVVSGLEQAVARCGTGAPISRSNTSKSI